MSPRLALLPVVTGEEDRSFWERFVCFEAAEKMASEVSD